MDKQTVKKLKQNQRRSSVEVLADLRSEGMKIESASRGESEISASYSPSTASVNKVGKYSYKSLRNTKPPHPSQTPPEQTIPTANYNRQQPRRPPQEKTCYNCGNKFFR